MTLDSPPRSKPFIDRLHEAADDDVTVKQGLINLLKAGTVIAFPTGEPKIVYRYDSISHIVTFSNGESRPFAFLWTQRQSIVKITAAAPKRKPTEVKPSAPESARDTIGRLLGGILKRKG